MYIQFNPRTLAPIGASAVKSGDNFIEIDKEMWLKFLLNPSLFAQYEAVLQSDGSYTLEKIKEKSYTLKNRYFELEQITPAGLASVDVLLTFYRDKATLAVNEAVNRRYDGMTFFVCADKDPDQLYDTLVFKKVSDEIKTDILEQLDSDRLGVFGSFKYLDLKYGFTIST